MERMWNLRGLLKNAENISENRELGWGVGHERGGEGEKMEYRNNK